MKYRVNFDATFDNEKDAIALLNYVESIKDKVYDSKDMFETPTISRLYKTFHDETPIKPCSHAYHVDFKTSQVIHKIEDLNTMLELDDIVESK